MEDKYSFLNFIKCLNRCRIHRKEADFTDMVLNGYRSPSFVKISENGDMYPGRIVFRINEFGLYNGFFSEFLFVLKKLLFADARGFVPMVYWGEDFQYYEPDGVDGELNAFKHYFNQLSDVDDTSKASFVITADDSHLDWVYRKYGCKAYEYPDEYIERLSAAAQKYVSYNDHLKTSLEKVFSKLTENKKTLAVHFRGTDYRRGYNNHPIFVTVEEEIAKAREVMDKGGYELLFLATDEAKAVDSFKNEFGDRLRYFEDVKRGSADDDSVAFDSDKSGSRYRLGFEVVRDQYFLTRCHGLICGVSNLTVAARVLRKAWYEEPYEDLIIIDHGYNHNKNSFSKAKH